MKSKFYTKVDKRSRMQMTDFLLNHLRYSTLNSWNGLYSWANNLKVYNVIPGDLQNKVFEMMDCENFYDDLNFLLEDAETSEYCYGFNGRSGGYLVMYHNAEKGHVNCGSVDDYDEHDYKYMPMDQLVEIVERVQMFDKLCDDIVNQVIYMAKHLNVKEESFQVTKTYKVLSE